MSRRTFVENFACTNKATLCEAINKTAARLKSEILSISMIYLEKSKWPYQAIVVFEKDIVITALQREVPLEIIPCNQDN
ncbi:arabinose ABC transporter permease [Acinetobacter soli]|uniref:arabinose ABC transporter permease n=1 Tax=Acinetobacter soli TaxID=487316 RepID=UPI000CE48F18|nr:arabinose ABC transporter permease [Acinetobacter soli]PPB87752.1 hypothetical protein AsoHEU7_03465 [Acinetobacter soli]